MIYPRQTDSMGMPSMDGMSMDGMSMSMTSSGMGPGSTMSMNSNDTSNGGLKLTPAVIAILAVIGGSVVFIFVGFLIHARVREYKLRKHPNAQQQITSGSLSVSTYTGAPPPKVANGLATGSYSRIDQALAPPMPTDYEDTQPAAQMSSIPTDPTPLVPQRPPGYDTATEMEAPPYPQSSSHPYIGASMQQANLSNPIISPAPVNLAPKSPPLPYIPPGSSSRANDSMSNFGYDSATLVSGGGGRSPAPASPRPLPRVPQMARAASLVPSPRLSVSEQKGERSFLTFDGSDTRVNVLPPSVPDAVQRQPDQNISYNYNYNSSSNNNNNNNNNKSTRAVRLMTVIMDYDPELPDELEVKVGDTVRILREYDDGWCIAEHLSRSGKKPGAIPRMCLEERSSG